MIDRRKHPREFFVAGWDPYIVSLVSDRKAWDQPLDPGRSKKLGPTRWRTMLLSRSRSDSR
jgi:hypothetical protein